MYMYIYSELDSICQSVVISIGTKREATLADIYYNTVPAYNKRKIQGNIIMHSG
jgi:hypothetical protein